MYAHKSVSRNRDGGYIQKPLKYWLGLGQVACTCEARKHFARTELARMGLCTFVGQDVSTSTYPIFQTVFQTRLWDM